MWLNYYCKESVIYLESLELILGCNFCTEREKFKVLKRADPVFFSRHDWIPDGSSDPCTPAYIRPSSSKTRCLSLVLRMPGPSPRFSFDLHTSARPCPNPGMTQFSCLVPCACPALSDPCAPEGFKRRLDQFKPNLLGLGSV